MKITDVTLRGAKLTFPYVMEVKTEKDKKNISFIADKNNPVKVGDVLYDELRQLGYRKNNPDLTIHFVALKVEKVLSERKAKGDFSFTTIEPIIQFTTCSEVEMDLEESQIEA